MTSKTTPKPEARAPQTSVDPGNGLAITSLVLGILSLTGFFFLTGVPAIITGVMSLRKKQQERGMSIAGIVMGSIGTLLSLLMLLALVLIVMLGVMSDPSGMQGTPTFDMDMDMPIDSSRT